MGNLAGHIGPAILLLGLGTIMFLKSLNVSIFLPRSETKKDGSTSKKFKLERAVALFPSMRQSSRWLSIEAQILVVANLVGIIGELTDMLISHSDAGSHYDHLRLFVCLGTAGLFFLLHFHNLLNDVGWMMIMPFMMGLAGKLLSVHPQSGYFRQSMHEMSSIVMAITAVSRVFSVLVSCYCNQEYHQNVQKAEEEWKDRKVTVYTLGINSIYTNLYIYTTVLPLFEAFTVLYNGVLWTQMAELFYIHPPAFLPPEDAMHMGGGHGEKPMINQKEIDLFWKVQYQSFIALILCMAFTSILLKKCFARKSSSEQLNNEEDGVELPLRSNT